MEISTRQDARGRGWLGPASPGFGAVPHGVRPAIDHGLSLYLDVLRVCAALVVMLSHDAPVLFGADSALFPGHDAVIVFFVMSGYVIAYVSEGREDTPSKYALSRLSRLWSVAIPALGVAAIAAVLDPSATDRMQQAVAFVWRSLLNAAFLGESWGGEVLAPYNSPMWSLNYEAWYYAIFGAWAFLAGRTRTVAVAALCLGAGPKIIALMPCWLLGVALYRWRDRLRLQKAIAACLLAGSVVLYAAAYHFDLATTSRGWMRALTHGQSYHLGPSSSLIGDSILAVLMAAHIVAVANMPTVGRVLDTVRRPIRTVASCTLSIYLFHVPLLEILHRGLGLGGNGGAEAWAALGLSGLAIVGLSSVTEHRRSAWRAALARVVPHAP